MTQHECSCGDKAINHAHEFPELGCICLTCNENAVSRLVMYDEEVIHNLTKMIPLIESMKTVFDHVRGDVEAREIMVVTINRAIEIIKNKQGTINDEKI
jgi:hypothetical protein